jgi:poly(3-hydroxybutyrate) depolymerase
MIARLLHLLARLRVWLAVRLGRWRGRWRRGQVSVARTAASAWPWSNVRWSYGLYCPAGLADATAAPLVLLLHGCRQRALGFAQASGWVAVAERRRWRLLCPQQRRRANPWRCWNWFMPAAQRGAGEVELMRALLDQAARRVNVAEGQVAAVGLSAGAALAALLALHAAERVRAVVTVAAPPLLGRATLVDPREVMRRGLDIDPAAALTGSARPAALLIVHGRADAVVAPVCAEQWLAQVLEAHQRAGQALEAVGVRSGTAGSVQDWRRDGRLQLRMQWFDALGHAWTGAADGHPYVCSDGPDLTAAAQDFLQAALAPPAPRRGAPDGARATAPPAIRR